MSNKKKIVKKSFDKNHLKNYKINVNEFGEIKTNLDIDAINEFLDEHVEDKKLKDREDIDELRKGSQKVNTNKKQDEG
ncbi:MAG: hypothetical protein AB8B69_26870 [Chitinophagales bacterium]